MLTEFIFGIDVDFKPNTAHGTKKRENDEETASRPNAAQQAFVPLDTMILASSFGLYNPCVNLRSFGKSHENRTKTAAMHQNALYAMLTGDCKCPGWSQLPPSTAAVTGLVFPITPHQLLSARLLPT